MKKLLTVFLLTMLIFAISMNFVLAAEHPPRLVDTADLLTEGEEKRVISLLDEISERQKMDVVIVTVNTLGGKKPSAYADDYYDYNGYGFGENYDGILLLVSMEDRDWFITTTGYGITAFTDRGIDYMSDAFVGDLSSGWYEDAFTTYAELCDEFITQAKTGSPYDVGNMPREPYPLFRNLLLSVGIGLVIAWLITYNMKSKLKSVRSKATASDYMKKNSLRVTEANDFFLYRHVSRQRKQNDSRGGSGIRTSSSGRSHGGGGGKF